MLAYKRGTDCIEMVEYKQNCSQSANNQQTTLPVVVQRTATSLREAHVSSMTELKRQQINNGVYYIKTDRKEQLPSDYARFDHST